MAFGKDQFINSALKRAGIPVGPELTRPTTAWSAHPLNGKKIAINNTDEGAKFAPIVRDIVLKAGATLADRANSEQKVDALIFDATDLKITEDLKRLYSFFHEGLAGLNRNGRCLILTKNPSEIDHPEEHAIQRGIDGFSRAMAKEIGRKGATSQILVLSKTVKKKQAAQLLDQPVRFFLSNYSAFITGQSILIEKPAKQPKAFPNDNFLKDKVALVTGAGRGIGAATAWCLSQEGAKIIVLDRPEEGEQVIEVVQKTGGVALLADVTKIDSPDKIADFIESEFGGLDILVHNAGVTRDKTLAKMYLTMWDQVINVNLRAILRITDTLLERKLINDHARITTLSSISGLAGNFGQTNYCTTKAAVIGWARAQSKALSSKGITVNAVAPGFIETQMTSKIPFFTREAGRKLSNLAQGGLPEDIAEAICFLSSPGACGISGQSLRVCGGNFIGA